VHDTRRTRIVLGVLLAAALALITINYRGGTSSRVGGLRGLGGSVFGSVESAVTLVTRPVAAFTDGLTGSSSQSKINALQRQVVDLRAQLNQQRLSKYDEGQLGQLLQLAGRGRYRIVTASVIAAGAAYDDSVTIDAGRVDGIKPDETVLNGQGLVGTVTSASATTATVLLATDASVTVGVRLAGTGQIGVVSGTGKSMTGAGLLRLQVFDVNAILHRGQELVTFGSAEQLADQGGAGPPVRRRHRARCGRRRGRPATDRPEVLRAAAQADPVPECFSDRLAGPSRGVPRRHRFSRDHGFPHRHRTEGLTCGVRRWRPRCCCSPS
jgi:rod shape-determining protein MreC